jgi:hypothetical protein
MPADGREEAYKVHAAACLEIAPNTDDREGKIALLDIARAWLALADQHDKNSQTTLVFETRRRSRAGRPFAASATHDSESAGPERVSTARPTPRCTIAHLVVGAR